MRRWLLRPLTGVLVVLLAGFGALVWWSTDIGPAASTREAGIAGARAAGRQIAVNISSYDYTKLDKQFAVVAGDLTGGALSQFQSQQSMIKSYWTSNKIVTTAAVDDDAVVPGATATAATVMVALTVSESVGGQAQNSNSVLVRLILARRGSAWVAETVGNASG